MKIAIYSGVSPSTTFIERLIVGLSESEMKILLVGKKFKNIKYNFNVINATSKNLIYQIYYIFRYFYLSEYIFYNDNKTRNSN